MPRPYAEVIGDPVAHSLSPLIHEYWLGERGIDADYRAAHIREGDLSSYLSSRRNDPDWLGCNVTIPHKAAVLPFLDDLEPEAKQIGAINCIYRGPRGLTGRNSDVDGIAAALAGCPLRTRKAAIIGAGGGAKAAFQHFLNEEAASIALVVHNPAKADWARRWGANIEIHDMADAEPAFQGAGAIINATPLGMDGMPEMPVPLLDAIAEHARDAVLMDMVYKPLETRFLAHGRAGGGHVIDGLHMLVGQARRAFAAFFGEEPPPGDKAVRKRLIPCL